MGKAVNFIEVRIKVNSKRTKNATVGKQKNKNKARWSPRQYQWKPNNQEKCT